MKKIYFFLTAIVLLCYACSSDSADNSDAAPLLKEVQSTYVSSTGTSTMVYRYTYNGNKISTLKMDDYWESHYTYEGDLIVSFSNYSYGDLMVKTDYQYDNEDRLIKETATEYQEGASETITYTYNSDNTITALFYDGTVANPANLFQTSRITRDSAGRPTVMEDWDGTGWVTRLQASYSSYYSPLRNIVGYDKLLFFLDVKNGFATFAQLNNTVNPQFNNASVFDYTVNAANYPTQRIQTVTNNDGSTTVGTSNYIYY
ncbi:hypothetical protein [Flavobacterium sp. XGLA_31]|uniref:hypothetical protein n=1 Tax=Flavobacterium sp. XGLA_31 TaxID=3447666 RepID=UPI003F40FDCC